MRTGNRVPSSRAEYVIPSSVRQGVGDLREELTVRQVMYDLQSGYLEALDRLALARDRLGV